MVLVGKSVHCSKRGRPGVCYWTYIKMFAVSVSSLNPQFFKKNPHSPTLIPSKMYLHVGINDHNYRTLSNRPEVLM